MTDEQVLWQAVITQAMIDIARKTTPKQKADVEYWLGSMDFIEVCCNASLDPCAIEAVFWEIISEPELAKRKIMVNNIVYEKRRITSANVARRNQETI